jgi:hypothetical protein
MEKIKKILPYFSAVVVPALMLAFNVGYTKSEIEDKPSRLEVKGIVDTAITKYEIKQKSVYVRIDQVPGLSEQLIGINKQLEDLNKKFDKMETKLIYGSR